MIMGVMVTANMCTMMLSGLEKVSFGRRRCQFKLPFPSVPKLIFKRLSRIGICHTEEINKLNRAHIKIFRGQICTLRNAGVY